ETGVDLERAERRGGFERLDPRQLAGEVVALLGLGDKRQDDEDGRDDRAGGREASHGGDPGGSEDGEGPIMKGREEICTPGWPGQGRRAPGEGPRLTLPGHADFGPATRGCLSVEKELDLPEQP